MRRLGWLCPERTYVGQCESGGTSVTRTEMLQNVTKTVVLEMRQLHKSILINISGERIVLSGSLRVEDKLGISCSAFMYSDCFKSIYTGEIFMKALKMIAVAMLCAAVATASFARGGGGGNGSGGGYGGGQGSMGGQSSNAGAGQNGKGQGTQVRSQDQTQTRNQNQTRTRNQSHTPGTATTSAPAQVSN